jgi:AcrR family transcriptional regulator
VTTTPDELEEDEPSNVTELPVRGPREVRVPRGRVRMSGQERREQLLDVGRKLFAEKGFEAVSVEEIASKAGVSKPVVYEHFGGKEGLYAVVVDREMTYLLLSISEALGDQDNPTDNARILLERAALALFDYIEQYPDGFRILVRDSPTSDDPEVVGTLSSGRFANVIVDVAARVQDLLARQFKAHGINPKLAPMYSQMLVGMVALTGQWWLDARKPKKHEVVAHLVNLAWHGLEHMQPKPRLVTKDRD